MARRDGQPLALVMGAVDIVRALGVAGTLLLASRRWNASPGLRLA